MGRMRRSRREAFRSRFPEEEAPAAPLRALRYTSAGGRHVRNQGNPRENSQADARPSAIGCEAEADLRPVTCPGFS